MIKHFRSIKNYSTSLITYKKPKINTVVFDLYETIIFPKKHLRPAPVQAFINTFNYYGFYTASSSILLNHNDTFMNIIDKHMGTSKRNHLISILNEPYMKSFYESIKKENITIDDMYKKFIEIQCEILYNPDYCTLEPNYHIVEHNLRKMGVQYFCFTTGFNSLMTSIIFHHLPNLHFNKIITTDTVKSPRPNPEGLYKIMEKCNVCDYNVIKIGDTIADIQEANNASVISVGITTGSTTVEQFKQAGIGADYVINNLSYLPTLIEHINSSTDTKNINKYYI